MAVKHPDILIDTIVAGKFRRYHNVPFWQQLLRIRTIVLPNIIDSVKIATGVVQSLYKMARWRPDVVFAKGGYVCLPIGISARIFGIPLVIHDSDTHPGLTSRILSKRARYIATGAPLEYYDYPADRAHYVGIPISTAAKVLSDSERKKFKKSMGFSGNRPLIVVTGGGLGARRINDAVLAIADGLTELSDVQLVTGKGLFDEVSKAVGGKYNNSLRVVGYVPVLSEVMAAADIVVTRAGATTMLELAAMKRPTIIIPNAHLTGGHQIKNAQMYEQANAAEVIHEDDLEQQPYILLDTISRLLNNKNEITSLSTAIGKLAMPHAARDVAALVIAARKR